MKTISQKEFEQLYGKQAVADFGTVAPKAPSLFNTQAAGDVFKRAGQDVQLASQKSPAFGATTAVVQGGLSPFRAVSEGIMGTQTGQKVMGSVASGLTSFGNVITPEPVKAYIGSKATQAIEGFQSMKPEDQLKERNKLAVAEALSYFLGGTATKNTLVAPTVKTAETVTKNTANAAFKEAQNLKKTVQTAIGKSSLGDQVEASVTRLVEKPTKLQSPQPTPLNGTSARTPNIVDEYEKYLAQSTKAINDIKEDPAISTVGSEIGDAFNEVVKQRRTIGTNLGDELKVVGNIRVSLEDPLTKVLNELQDSGLSYNPTTRQLTSFQGTKFVPEEIAMLNQFLNRMKLIGGAPTVKNITDFISRTYSDLEFTKGRTGVMGTTNAERIINGAIAGMREALDPANNGIAQLGRLTELNRGYSQLSDFVEEGSKYLGKLTQAGDFAKDASIAKSAVQSILNNGKKDWLIKLEELTNYPALDKSVLALQAMKDAGDYRGLSLLQAMAEGGVPMSKAGATQQLLDYGLKVGARVIAGTPADRTRAFLKSIAKSGVDLKKPSPKVVAKGVPKTPEIAKIEKQIAKNVDSQKAAIKAGDFVLVAKLKEVYDVLVEKLKKLAKEIKESAKNPGMGLSTRDVTRFLHEDDKLVMKAYIDSVRLDKDLPKGAEQMADKLMERFGILPDQDAGKIADKFEAILEGRREFTGTVLPGMSKETSYGGKSKWTGTKSSKPSTVSNTSTSKKLTGKEGVSGQSTDTLGDFDTPTLYHGSAQKITGDIRPSENGILGKGFYLTQDPKVAEMFGKTRNVPEADVIDGLQKIIDNSITPEVYSVDTSKLKLKELSNAENLQKVLGKRKIEELQKELIERGYDGISLTKRGEHVIFPSSIKKIQLKPTTAMSGGGKGDLLSEARKYKSVEEFVKSQGKTVYHGTNADFEKFDNKMVGSNTGEMNTIGTFFAETKSDVDAFKKTLSQGFGRGEKRDISNFRTIERIIPSDAKFFNLDYGTKSITTKEAEILTKLVGTEDGEILKGADAVEYIEGLIDDSVPGEGLTEVIFENADDFKKLLTKNGYIGYTDNMGSGKKEYVVFDPEKSLLNRTQLEDIWKQANKADPSDSR